MINIVTVDYYLDDKKIVNIGINGYETLLDADVVIFDPSMVERLWENEVKYNGANVGLIYSPLSDQIRQVFNSRKNEVETLLENGKIIISILHPISGFKGEIGDKGKFDVITNYDYLPLPQDYFLERLKSGSSNQNNSLKHHPKGKTIFSQFFYAFRDEIEYSAYFDFDASENSEYFILNKANRPIATFQKYSNGLIILLPPLNYNKDDKKFIGVIRQCAERFLFERHRTPPPTWTNLFILNGETEFEEKLDSLINEIDTLQEEKNNLEKEKLEISQYKDLLFEQGIELEHLVLKSFSLFGFNAENRKQDDLEHDVVFESEEGRGIAEIEGKDNDAIHISKLDQLNRAVDEDFELTETYPQGLLIGNHYRLTNPKDRKEAFTEKVHIVATKKSFGLLTTLEIYKAVDYLLQNPNDESFKKKCREKILTISGTEIKLTE
jgi:hypothetical protein